MKRLQAFKFQIEPNGEQIRAMRQYAGNARKIWNLALNRQTAFAFRKVARLTKPIDVFDSQS